MHPDNGYYGHRRILLDAAGIRENRRIAAHVQHGWQLGTGLNAKARLVRSLRKLVWGTRHEQNAIADGIRNVRAIGAPFAYLVRDERAEMRSDATGTIFFPFHSWHRGEAHGSHVELAAAIVQREGEGMTACLYHLEYERLEVRAVYERAGFRVVTAGPRDRNSRFLHFLLGELRDHQRVVSNHMGTAILYGGLLGLNAEVYGPTFAMEVLADDYHSRCRAAFPEIHRLGGATGEEAQAISVAELGGDLLLPSDELRRELGVAHSRPRRVGLMARTFLEHHVRRAAANISRG